MLNILQFSSAAEIFAAIHFVFPELRNFDSENVSDYYNAFTLTCIFRRTPHRTSPYGGMPALFVTESTLTTAAERKPCLQIPPAQPESGVHSGVLCSSGSGMSNSAAIPALLVCLMRTSCVCVRLLLKSGMH